MLFIYSAVSIPTLVEDVRQGQMQSEQLKFVHHDSSTKADNQTEQETIQSYIQRSRLFRRYPQCGEHFQTIQKIIHINISYNWIT